MFTNLYLRYNLENTIFEKRINILTRVNEISRNFYMTVLVLRCREVISGRSLEGVRGTGASKFCFRN